MSLFGNPSRGLFAPALNALGTYAESPVPSLFGPQNALAAPPRAPAPPPPTPWQLRYAVPDWRSKLTRLTPEQEARFRAWARKTGAPITPDYDMRGFWLSGEASEINPNDGLPHYTDRFKTPLHETFSGESIYADPSKRPPMWNDRDQLVAADGTVIYDERAQARRR